MSVAFSPSTLAGGGPSALVGDSDDSRSSSENPTTNKKVFGRAFLCEHGQLFQALGLTAFDSRFTQEKRKL